MQGEEMIEFKMMGKAMTWGEFKKAVEGAGVIDSYLIDYIDFNWEVDKILVDHKKKNFSIT
ncbi:MAG: hypothetical protein FD156_1207 [Nitrospirae bacterium]|nr:MAG: hypothetical protein FD156_1207 [Nitrospirota bacterium]